MSLHMYKDDENGSSHPFCNINAEQFSALTDAIKNLSEASERLGDKLDQLWSHIVRWLLIVVCAIALGKELLAVIKGLAAHG